MHTADRLQRALKATNVVQLPVAVCQAASMACTQPGQASCQVAVQLQTTAARSLMQAGQQ